MQSLIDNGIEPTKEEVETVLRYLEDNERNVMIVVENGTTITTYPNGFQIVN